MSSLIGVLNRRSIGCLMNGVGNGNSEPSQMRWRGRLRCGRRGGVEGDEIASPNLGKRRRRAAASPNLWGVKWAMAQWERWWFGGHRPWARPGQNRGRDRWAIRARLGVRSCDTEELCGNGAATVYYLQPSATRYRNGVCEVRIFGDHFVSLGRPVGEFGSRP